MPHTVLSQSQVALFRDSKCRGVRQARVNLARAVAQAPQQLVSADYPISYSTVDYTSFGLATMMPAFVL
jgi:ABC-type phosphate/phosphonate transport system ATPase subunit